MARIRLPPDVMNGDAAGRTAYLNLVLDYLKKIGRLTYILQDYTTFQNQYTLDRKLKASQVTELIKILDDYKAVLATCSED